MGSFGWADAGKRAGRTSFAEDDAGHRDWYSAEMGKSEVNVLIAMTYVAQTVDVKPVLHKIKAPVLGLYPTGGEVTTGDQFETMRRDIKDLKIVHLPGPRHLVQSLHPAACAEQVLHFMALHDGRACHE